MSNPDRDRYMYLSLDYGLDGEGTNIVLKMDDEGIEVDVFSGGFGVETIASRSRSYAEFGAKFNPFTGKGEMKMEDVHINLLLGDEVYWNDPDEGTCSGHGTFVRHLDDGAAIIRKDDVEIEVFVKELS